MPSNFNSILRQLVNAGIDIAAESMAAKMKLRPELARFAALPATISEQLKGMDIGQLPPAGGFRSGAVLPEPGTMRQWYEDGARFISEQSGYQMADILASRQVREMAIRQAEMNLHPDRQNGDAEQLTRLLSIARVMRALDEVR
jgi:hypothetical protein